MSIDTTRFVPDLIRWEGAIPWMYRDTMGYVTTAIGHLVHDAGDAAGLPFEKGGRPASAQEIGDDFLRVVALTRGMPASAYRGTAPGVELPAAAVRDLAILRLEREFIPGLTRTWPAFESFPAPAQSALVDLAWNVGLRGLDLFGHLQRAVDQQDWTAAAAACHRRTSREERNAWCRDLFLSCA